MLRVTRRRLPIGGFNGYVYFAPIRTKPPAPSRSARMMISTMTKKTTRVELR